MSSFYAMDPEWDGPLAQLTIPVLGFTQTLILVELLAQIEIKKLCDHSF